MDHEIWVKVSGTRCVLEGYVKEITMQGFTLAAITDQSGRILEGEVGRMLYLQACRY